jgi:alpha-1,6-mannosyltransferase
MVTTVHLTNAYHPASGGIRTFYHALLESGNARGRRVVLIVPGDRTARLDVGPLGRIYFIEAPRAPAFDRRYRLLLPLHYAPLVAAPVVRILEDERPALVEICDKYSLPYLAAMLRKGWHPRVPRPVLVGVSAERFDDNMAAYVSRSPALRRFTRWYIRNIYGPPFDVHLANSEYTAGELREALHDRAPGFIRVCPMGVDAAGFGPERRSARTRAHLLARVNGRDDTVLLLYAGRISPEKNIGLLVDTVRLLASGPGDFRLVIAGEGPLAEWVASQAHESLSGRVALLGALDREALAACCASCDVFVHPNPREPFGIAPLEAMASGVAVVVPNEGGVLEYANPGNAWVAPPVADAFAAAIRSAARGGPQVANALDTARAFAWTTITARYFQLYDELMFGAPGGLRRLDAAVTAG